MTHVSSQFVHFQTFPNVSLSEMTLTFRDLNKGQGHLHPYGLKGFVTYYQLAKFHNCSVKSGWEIVHFDFLVIFHVSCDLDPKVKVIFNYMFLKVLLDTTNCLSLITVVWKVAEKLYVFTFL